MATGVVLVGGLSSRMGQDKAALVLAGSTLLERALSCLHQAGVTETLVSGGQMPGAIADIWPQAGPVAGIHAILSHVLADAGDGRQGREGKPLLLMPVDMPLMTASVLRQLLAALLPGEQALHYHGQMFPCVLRATTTLRDHLGAGFAAIAADQAKKGPSMKELLAFAGARSIDGSGLPEEVFFNVNRPAEWARIVAHVEHHGIA